MVKDKLDEKQYEVDKLSTEYLVALKAIYQLTNDLDAITAGNAKLALTAIKDIIEKVI